MHNSHWRPDLFRGAYKNKESAELVPAGEASTVKSEDAPCINEYHPEEAHRKIRRT